MWLFSLFAIDVKLAGALCLISSVPVGALAWLSARMGWAWCAYIAVLLTGLFLAAGMVLICAAGGMQ